MLDVTGSMAKKGKKDKIGDLKAAATNAVEAMLANQDPKNPRVRVALVPYASGVNIGDLAKNVYAEQSGKSNLPPAATIPSSAARRGLPNCRPSALMSPRLPRPSRAPTIARPSARTRTASPTSATTARTRCASNKNGKKYYALVNRDDQSERRRYERVPGSRDDPADRRSGRAARFHRATLKRTALPPARSRSSGPTTCCRRNGGERSRPRAWATARQTMTSARSRRSRS